MSRSTASSIPHPSPWLRFVSGFVSRPQQVASLWPSSRRLRQRLASMPCLRDARVVVELGPGLGQTTEALLGMMPADSRLLGIEIVPQFVEYLQRIPDRRLSVIEGSAHQLRQHLKSHRISQADAVVSGIPFSSMSRAGGRRLLRQIHTVLAPGGTFATYQVRSQVCRLARQVFGPGRRTFELWNLPPLWIYEWRKDIDCPQ